MQSYQLLETITTPQRQDLRGQFEGGELRKRQWIINRRQRSEPRTSWWRYGARRRCSDGGRVLDDVEPFGGGQQSLVLGDVEEPAAHALVARFGGVRLDGLVAGDDASVR